MFVKQPYVRHACVYVIMGIMKYMYLCLYVCARFYLHVRCLCDMSVCTYPFERYIIVRGGTRFAYMYAVFVGYVVTVYLRDFIDKCYSCTMFNMPYVCTCVYSFR
jgi:hypothetical protein